MSSGSAQVAVLGRPGYRPAPRAAETAPLVRLAAFAALALYGTLRWSTLLSGGEKARLLGLWALAVLLAGARQPLARRSRVLAALFTTLALLCALTLSGIPLSWLWHLRIAVTIRSVGDGLAALPQISVPYAGADPWVRLDMVLGAAILLFDAALLLAFAPRAMEDLRCVGVALPLVALAAVPFTAVHAGLPYLAGAILFVLLAAFVWADRVGRRQTAGAFALCAAAGILATAAAPAIDRHRGWIDYQALAGSLAPKSVETFNWAQSYGPVDWPRHGRTVLEIDARRPEYWKTEDLDVFDGRAWTQGVVPGDQNTPRPSSGALSRWSETIRVNVRDMRSADVVGAGVSAPPSGFPHPVLAGFSAGTWTTGTDLEPGDTYTIGIYAPDPTPAQLSHAGSGYADVPVGYRTILLPPARAAASGASPQVVFAPFHSRHEVENVLALPADDGAQAIDRSPYAGAYRLARQLARKSATPYAFVLSVERFLAQGYIYDERPPPRAYPLASFLLSDRRGYCQHFAGAMALLLRMGGVPARVSAGFTQGRQAGANNKWLVTDTDAHAWVEAWFPQYGWVKFDPTPPADPALGGKGAADAISSNPNVKASLQPAGRSTVAATVHPRPRPRAPHGASTVDPGVLAAGVGFVALALLAVSLLITRPLGSPEALVSELERALTRSGLPPDQATTLAAIERRVGEGGEYVRVLRLARFGGRPALPTLRQRRALRRHLAGRGGPLRALQALWALPPRRRPRPSGTPASRATGSPES